MSDAPVAALPADPDPGRVVIGVAGPAFEPRPAREPVHRPDTVVDGWAAGPFVVRGASVRGDQHRHDGTPRQDDFAVAWHAGTGSVVVAVADGVSAAPLAHVGATLAVRTAVEQAHRALGDGGVDWEVALRWAAYALVQFAEKLPPEADGAAGDGAQADGAQGDGAAERAERVLATTLVLAVVTSTAEGAVADVVRVGDSGAWVLADGVLTPTFPAPEGEVLTSTTAALPRLPEQRSPTRVELPPGAALLLATDGVGVPLGDGRGAVGAAFAAALASPPDRLGFARVVDFSRETFDDDRTAVVVWS
ncbi:protein phosphatase 2C domain-containing protein [Actinokineospora bangkokensis]|uniref:PPM-type phosphatase domain-containing protein n=1 Tax=Actinokineospora bangkokensis TaxID=1193682 RepID=A0A1Q9LND6_9PSEU|nr:protein phosphatase 2C domain-containing protein [Actinokineospora bangkokensis]OLR93509.1 hypothetical protein BJP25_14490 [Actinokineospora bangkokensis]